MSSGEEFLSEATRHVRDTCLCVRVQRAARALARHFDEALRPVALTHGQFSLLVALDQTEPPAMGAVAAALAMDRTTLTANVKPLARRGLVKIATDKADKRSRRLSLTVAGRALLKGALPIWKEAHGALDRSLGLTRAERLRGDLRALAAPVPAALDDAAD